jgi:hypothetical protein
MTLTEWTDTDAACPGPLVAPAKAVVRLPPLDELVELWPKLGPMLAKATSRTGCHTPADVLQLAMQGQVGIWVCEVDGVAVAALVTKVEQYPRKRVLEIMLAGGSRMRQWIAEAVAVLDQHARAAGCQHIAGIGRPGWVRAWGGEATGDIVIVRDLRG